MWLAKNMKMQGPCDMIEETLVDTVTATMEGGPSANTRTFGNTRNQQEFGLQATYKEKCT